MSLLALLVMQQKHPIHVAWLEWAMTSGLGYAIGGRILLFAWRHWCETLFQTRWRRVRRRWRSTVLEIDRQVKMLRKASARNDIHSCNMFVVHIQQLEVRQAGEAYVMNAMVDPTTRDKLDFVTDAQIEHELRRRRRRRWFRRLTSGKSTALVRVSR